MTKKSLEIKVILFRKNGQEKEGMPVGKEIKYGKAALIWRFLRLSVWLFVSALLFSMLNTAFNAVLPQMIRITVDSTLGGAPFALPAWFISALELNHSTLERKLLLAALGILLAAALSGVCNFVSRLHTAKCSECFVKSIRDELYGHIQRLPFAWHTAHQTGEIIQRCTSDVEVIRSFVTNQLLEVFRTTFMVVFYLAVMWAMNRKITLVAMAFLPVIVAYSVFFYTKIASRFLAADEAEGELSTTVQENLTGVQVVRAFGRERYEIDRFDEKNEHFAQLWIRLGRLMSAYWGSGDFITGLQIMTVLLVGICETVGGNATPGEFLAFLTYNSAMVWPVRSLGRILSEMSKAGVSVDRVKYILDAEEEQEPVRPVKPSMDADIVFDHVSFGYEGQAAVLRDVCFTIPAGKTFAILGGTGSGKSTLMHLLDRLYDLPEGSGRITIGGVDIRTIPRGWLRGNIGMVLQEPFLFSRTIEENIKASRPLAGREEVRHAAATACVDRALAELSLGYETMVGERGVTLSGGQKQRVAIARMLMQKAPIMVFDDSLSAVDAETDAEIRAALKVQAAGSTVILISHRVTTLMQADHILVLEAGRVAEEGTHRALLERDGVYKRIYDIQMNGEDRLLLEETEGGEA